MNGKSFAVIVCLTLALVVPGNSCPCPNDDLVGDQTISDETIVAPPPPSQGPETPPEKSRHNQEFQDPMTELVEQELSTSMLTDALMLAIITAKKGDRRTRWEIVFALVFPSAILWLIFCEILPWRNMQPRVPSPLIVQLVAIFFVNGVFALLLPSNFHWVPTFCFVVSLLALIIVQII